MKVMGICDPRLTDPPRPSMARLESLQLLNLDFNADPGPDPHYFADPDPHIGPADLDPDRIYFNNSKAKLLFFPENLNILVPYFLK
jgi:hypothetical protein